ncbi:hypothetical protein [Rubinisphaera italica]|uniref:Uncharacterized protein n=1 Tax=Rubinisphaera italica TaxID=2527969 RepID=A0A5C5XAP3_9PLAN|nr:hypothetical protein [Rubinisphaera italica]TWT59471.1 hypothetical protein Pan54_01770 [Rubinisphaera italica]
MAAGGVSATVSRSRIQRGERGVWQRQFYRHTIHDVVDLKRGVDYLHVKPLKHGFVKRASEGAWSSFHRDIKLGEYAPNWGSQIEWYEVEFKNFE